MPEDKFSSLERLNIGLPSQGGEVSLLNSKTEESESLATLASRYAAVQEFLGQLSKMQGRLPAEVDKQLQALLQQLNAEQQLPGDNSTDEQPAKISLQPTMPTATKPLLQQLSILLSQQPAASIPATIKNQARQPLTADTIYIALVKLVQQQPTAWQQDTSLGKNTINLLVQSQLALKPEIWSTLPQTTKNQLIQASLLQPTTPTTPPQRQLIQQMSSQIFSLLDQQKNPINIIAGKSVVSQSEQTQTIVDKHVTNGLNSVLNTAQNNLITDLFSKDIQRPDAVKALFQQVGILLRQPEIATQLLNRSQSLLNNPLLNELNNHSLTANSITTIQTSMNALIPATKLNTANTANTMLSSTSSSDENIIWQRLLLQLSMPKIMQSPILFNQIKNLLPEQIWIPATSDELNQHKDDFELLTNHVLAFTQQLNITQSQNLTSSLPTTQANTPVSGNQIEDAIIAVQAINKNSSGNNTAVLQQLFHVLQQELLPQQQTSTKDSLSGNIQSAAAQLLEQFNIPIQNSDNVRSWMQFILQPLDGDGVYAKAMQQWCLQLLQARAKTSEKIEQMHPDNDSEITNLKNQLKTFDKLSENTLEAFRPTPQPSSNNNGTVPPLLHFPLPVQQNGREQDSLTLQRNTREDNERGWSISLYLELDKLGPIRFQARIALPEIALSIVAEKTKTIDLIKQTYPLLEQRFQSFGLTPQALQIRQGKIKKEKSSTSPYPISGLSIKV